MADPQGGPTLLFTDIEGSTLLLRELKGSYGLLLRVHQRMLERTFDDHHGRSMGSEGDSLFYVFPKARDAVAAAVTAQQRVEHYSWPEGVRLRVRIGIHRGPVTISGGEYLGLTVHEVSRICAVVHGGQIVCSSTVVDALGRDHAGAELRDLGTFVLRGFPAGTRLFQVCAPGLDDEFPPLRDTVRAGGRRMSIWFRQSASPSATSGTPESLGFETVTGRPLGPGTDVEILPAAPEASGAFRIVVTRDGHVEEEYDGLTIGGATDAATVVNAHSRLIRITR
jgi:class 3 adenylate cyclase